MYFQGSQAKDGVDLDLPSFYQVLIINLSLSALKVKLTQSFAIVRNLTIVFRNNYNEMRTVQLNRRGERLK